MVDVDKWCVRDAYKTAHMMYRVVLHEYQLVMKIQTIWICVPCVQSSSDCQYNSLFVHSQGQPIVRPCFEVMDLWGSLKCGK